MGTDAVFPLVFPLVFALVFPLVVALVVALVEALVEVLVKALIVVEFFQLGRINQLHRQWYRNTYLGLKIEVYNSEIAFFVVVQLILFG